jgi:hypothetical protein
MLIFWLLYEPAVDGRGAFGHRLPPRPSTQTIRSSVSLPHDGVQSHPQLPPSARGLADVRYDVDGPIRGCCGAPFVRRDRAVALAR